MMARIQLNRTKMNIIYVYLKCLDLCRCTQNLNIPRRFHAAIHAAARRRQQELAGQRRA
jgi:hypothetical protein